MVCPFPEWFGVGLMLPPFPLSFLSSPLLCQWHLIPLNYDVPIFHPCLLWCLSSHIPSLPPSILTCQLGWMTSFFCVLGRDFLPSTQLPLHYTPLLLSPQDKQRQWSGDKEHRESVSADGGQCHWGTLRELHLCGCQQAGSHKCQPIPLQ